MKSIKRRKKIVLAEGESIIADILPRFLRPFGYEMIVVPDGKQALELIKKELPDLIIIDSRLEIIDGFQLSQILKSDFLTSYIPIIILIEKKQIRKRILEIQEGIDDYIIKPPDPIDLQVRLEMALRRTDHTVHANSLTRLPGNKDIETMAKKYIKSRQPFSFLYLDINRFKSFNDTYGYLRGDGVIMQTARLITNAVKIFGNKGDFVGHVGGDDFVVITTPQREKAVADQIIKEFNRLIPLHYNKEDRLAGYLKVSDRQDHEVKAPLMGISVAIVNNVSRRIHNIIELTEIASEIKKHLKTLKGSHYLINRRTNTGKHFDEQGLEKEYAQAQPISLNYDDQYRETLPLGQILLKEKLITEKELQEALFEHWSSRQLLGQTLLKMNLISEEKLEPFLEKSSEN